MRKTAGWGESDYGVDRGTSESGVCSDYQSVDTGDVCGAAAGKDKQGGQPTAWIWGEKYTGRGQTEWGRTGI